MSGLVAYEQAQAIGERVGRRRIPVSSMWRVVQAHGERLRAYQAKQQAAVGLDQLALGVTDHGQAKSLSMDGGMVNTRGKGWKEMKIGTVGDVILTPNAMRKRSPDQPQKAERWLNQRKDDLFQGHTHAITTPLDQAGLTDHSHYFHTHQRRMQYHECREAGWPIGSGTVESAAKQYKARLAGPGMRWSRPNAERMLVIRSAVLGNAFDGLWDAA